MDWPVEAGALLLIEVDGKIEAVDILIKQLETVCMSQGAEHIKFAETKSEIADLWKARKAISPALFQYGPDKSNEDIVVPRSRIPDMVRKIDALKEKTGLTMVSFGHAGDGNIHFNIMLDKQNKDELEKFIKINTIDTIINCAAYTAVDDAEKNEALANSVNRDAVKILAELALENSIQLIHLSTDYVFDSNKHTPFNEDDETNPQSVYAKSKLAGENEIRRINPANAIIIRTSWVYSSFGSNFVQTMLKLGKNKKELNVVCDQIGTPTYAGDLAEVIIHIIIQKSKNYGTYHYSNEGIASWYDFAKAIFDFSNIKIKVNPIKAEAYPTPAKRPEYSVMDKSKIKKFIYNYNLGVYQKSGDQDGSNCIGL